MREILLTNGFRRDFKKFVKGDKKLQHSVEETLKLMEVDPFAPFLHTHKLGGKYLGFYSCSCGYDCRIVFQIEKDKSSNKEVIVLSALGTHDDVY